jgi:hypothetical protein
VSLGDIDAGNGDVTAGALGEDHATDDEDRADHHPSIAAKSGVHGFTRPGRCKAVWG